MAKTRGVNSNRAGRVQGKESRRPTRRKHPLRKQPIGLRAKLLMALEPPIDGNPAHLDGTFRNKLDAVLSSLAAAGTPFRLVEGFRTVERQQWLYGSGRPAAVPYGRSGPILTYKDGVADKSTHQGDGTAGSGRAADCYPLKNGQVYIPPVTDPVWRRYADAAIAQGLRAGLDFPGLKDAPHCELA